MLPFTPEQLEAAVADGHVTKRAHPSLPYFIYNYSPSVQYEKRWNDVTLNCRGLILDENYNIIARPWKKFFNLGEVNLPFQLTDRVEVMDKADGSLGILYPSFHPDGLDVYWHIATRGSFTSEQAHRANQIWRDKYSNFDPMPGYTMLFEIIYPSNRIVLDYGGIEDLVLLGAVENATGYYLGPREAKSMWRERGHLDPNYLRYSEWPGPVVDVFDYSSVSEALGHMDRTNAEGYVIRSHNFMVKLKQPDYLELHRLVTNASPRTVWEQLKDGKSKSEIVSAFPDEFHDYVTGMIDPLEQAFEQRLQEILDEHDKRCAIVYNRHESPGRKDFALEFKKSPEAKFHFLLLDGKSIREVVWSSLKPTATRSDDDDECPDSIAQEV